MGTKNNPGQYDCYANAKPDEPMFVLLGRDRHAPGLVRLWAMLRSRNGEKAEIVEEAQQCADAMHAYVLGEHKEPVNIINELLNKSELKDFAMAVQLEAVHQRNRWGSDHDAGKTPEDWFWLIGWLAGKAVRSQNAGDVDKALHHCITAAAVLANWHAAIAGVDTSMRPGIAPPAEPAC